MSLDLWPGEVLVLIGPNGSGKSTLLKVLSGYLSPARGQVELLGKPLGSYAPQGRARVLASLPQENQLPPTFTVEEAVEMGRYPHLPPFSGLRAVDRQAVEAALSRMKLSALRSRFLSTLSGGEKQRVFLARALAQEPRILLLDEPLSRLDVNHALELLATLQKLARGGMGILAVEHHLAYARLLASRAVALREGKILAEGSPEDIFQVSLLAALYGVQGEHGEALQRLLGR
ncbi:MAG: ABC transporter ATP-binding protein [Bacillota bacterium]|nr:ABC transporter ATP-binding protein [Bacillota bacterium]